MEGAFLKQTLRTARTSCLGPWSLLCCLLPLLMGTPVALGQELTWEYSVQVSAQIQTQPPLILLSWPQDMATLPDYYSVSRKAPADTAWGPAVVLPGTSTNYLDASVVAGVAYEYQVYKSTSNHVGYGYLCAGITLPALENRGKIILLVDQTCAAGLANELTRLQQDLAGDGWCVLRHDILRDMSVPTIKAIIQADYAADPANVKALLLFGRIPVPYSGDAAPDGHPAEHTGAWPADVFYGVMDADWTDMTVTDESAGDPRNWNVPGDGKFDQSEIPGPVRLETGRVDFHNMPGIDTNGVGIFPSELELLRRYLNKDHNYRHKIVSLPARGLVFNGTGDRQGEAFAADAWRNYAPLLGPGAVTSVAPDEFLPVLQASGYQWAYASCGSDAQEMSYLGGDGPWSRSGTTLDFVQMDIQTEFAMLLGSWLGDWDTPDNLMRGILATPTYGLSCVYAGRPHWYFHPMGIGETLGYCARLTQNNHPDGLYRNQSNNFAGFVHIALLGDPTLRLHTVAPPSNLRGYADPGGVQLSWSPSAEPVAGYYVYRAMNPGGPFVRLNTSFLKGTSFLISDSPPERCTYMVRAVKLQSGPSGSYFNLSQGVFTSLNGPPSVTVSASLTNLTLAWLAFPGRVYRLLWNDSLISTNWAPLTNDLLATDYRIVCTISAALSGSGWTFTNTNPSSAGNVVWVDDGLPAGAVTNPEGGEPWIWVSNAPAPYSGLLASQSPETAGMHQHYFASATSTLTLGTGDVLMAAVYLSPVAPPQEIMLQWNDGATWEHRAFWGSDRIYFGTSGTPGHVLMGALPPAGQWFLLQVPASVVGLEGSTVSGLAFTAYGGGATWDYAGKFSPGLTNSVPAILPGGLSPGVWRRFYKVVLLP